MKKALTLVWITALLALYVAPAVNTTAYASDVVQVSKTSSSSEMRKIEARAVINAPPTHVWKAMTDYKDFTHYMPGYRKCTIVKNANQNKTLDVAIAVSRLLPAYNYRVVVSESPKDLRLNFKRISGDLNDLKASYKLSPANGGKSTVIHYTMYIDPGFGLPGVNHILKSNAEKTLAAVRARSNQNHKKSLIGNK